MRIARVNVMIPDCPQCGNPIVVNGFTQRVVCESCHSDIAIHPDQWRSLFQTIYDETAELVDESGKRLPVQIPGMFEIQVEGAGVDVLPCSKCGHSLVVENMDRRAETLFCHNCGQKHPLSVLPNNTRAKKSCFAMNSASFSDEPLQNHVAPIGMNCPNCGGGLKISRDHERITTCEFCSGEFMIPDPLWKRLHPVKTVQPWYVLFDQPPPPTAAERAEMQQREAENRKVREKQQRLEAEKRRLSNSIQELNRKIKNASGGFGTAIGVGYGVCAFIGLFLIGFPFVFIPSLTHLIGDRVCEGAFEVQTSQTSDGTSYDYFCTIDGVRDSCDIVALYAILIGAGTLCLLWTLYLPVVFFRIRKEVKSLEFERNLEEERLFALESRR